MLNYLARRLILLPITLFCIILVNFVIINLAPGEPVTVTEITPEGGASRKEGRSGTIGGDMRYLSFREFYGLTLPILLNTWPFLTQEYVNQTLNDLIRWKNQKDIKTYDRLRILFGDQSRFVMPKLLHVMNETTASREMRRLASHYFVRGGTRQAHLGPDLTEDQKAYNNKISQDNIFLRNQNIGPQDSASEMEDKIKNCNSWYKENRGYYDFEPSDKTKWEQCFFETRFFRYMKRVVTLDFGTLRNNDNKTVISEVSKRFKYSLTLTIIPMLVTFIICQVFGCIMAYNQNRWPDYFTNFICLVLYAIPVFVVAPFLIEKIALHHHFPFTQIPIPISGFTSPERTYAQLTSLERLLDIISHIALPIVAVMYGMLASEARLSRTAILEVLKQDYVRTARAKGLGLPAILVKHVGRNASITIVTSLANSLGILLGGSLIVETIFGIDGFGKFFYDAIVNRDYNVIMFSAIGGAFLTLVGHLVADIAYTFLDPRVTLE